jgi:hypothetical protein
MKTATPAKLKPRVRCASNAPIPAATAAYADLREVVPVMLATLGPGALRPIMRAAALGAVNLREGGLRLAVSPIRSASSWRPVGRGCGRL